MPVSDRYQLTLDKASFDTSTASKIMQDFSQAAREKDAYVTKIIAGTAIAGVSTYGLFCFSGICFIGVVLGSVVATNSYNLYMKKTKDLGDLGKSNWVKIDS